VAHFAGVLGEPLDVRDTSFLVQSAAQLPNYPMT
jgi:hypothetical protein